MSFLWPTLVFGCNTGSQSVGTMVSSTPDEHVVAVLNNSDAINTRDSFIVSVCRYAMQSAGYPRYRIFGHDIFNQLLFLHYCSISLHILHKLIDNTLIQSCLKNFEDF